MKKNLFVFLAVLCLFYYTGKTQTQFGKIKNIQVELGYSAVFGNEIKLDRMRTQSSYSYYYYQSPNNSASILYAGVKPEFAINRKFSLLAGVRFTVTPAALKAENDYFYWLYNQDATNTYFAQIRQINQQSYFVGIPLELRFSLVRKQKRHFEMYAKLGTSIDFRLATNTQLHFVNSNMQQYKNEIVNQLGKPSNMAFPIQPGLGLRFGSPKKTSFCMEFNVPMYANTQSFGMKNIGFAGGVGIQFNILIPVNKK